MEFTQRSLLDKKLAALQKSIYQNARPIANWQFREERFVAAGQYQVLNDWQPIGVGERWECRDGITRRFRTTVEVPAFSGRNRVLVLDLGGEGLVRINGTIISNVTAYRPGSQRERVRRNRVYLPDGCAGRLEVEAEVCLNYLEFMDLRAQGFDREEYVLRTAMSAEVNETIEAAYFDLFNAVEAMDTFSNPAGSLARANSQLNPMMQTLFGAMDRDAYFYDKIRDAAQKALLLLDLDGDADRLAASVPAARLELDAALKAIPYRAHARVKFVGQAHIDTAWLWPIKESIRKCAKTFANTLALMDRYPDYIFAFSQPQLFAYTEEFYPELFSQIKKRVAEGRIELVGNSWVEMDTNVPSGEALVRQLLYGRQYYLEKFGKASAVFWMPDVFGYSWALPQIIIRSGVKYFFTSKLINNDTNRFPHSLFQWQGVDGTRIPAYLQKLNYNGELNAATLSAIYQKYEQKGLGDNVLMTIGYGDGGGGPSYQMLELAKRLQSFPGLPESGFATAESFFTASEKNIPELPVWNDEMYYEFHRGTYTSQANTKKNNRRAELLLRRTEMACAFAHILLGRPYPAREIGELWKKALTNQFHDILPGSSIAEVYADCDRSYQEIFAAAQTFFDESIQALNQAVSGQPGESVIWNFLSWPELQPVPVPALGCSVIRADQADSPENTHIASNKSLTAHDRFLTASEKSLENTWLRLTLDENGQILSLYDKENGREALSSLRPSNLLTIFEDSPARESAWNIDLEYQNKSWDLIQAESVQLAEQTKDRAVIRTVRHYNRSTITQDIILTPDAHRIDFATTVDWQETEKMLKAAFFPKILSSRATYEIQFGAIERPTHWNTSYDKARFEVPAHKWADLSEGHYGVSLLNDCKYGYDIKDSRMRLTLLRSPNYPDPGADKGSHHFVYSIYPHAGDWRSGRTVREAFRLNVPTLTLPVGQLSSAGQESLPAFSFAAADALNVVIDTIKGAEDGDGIILRVYESEGAHSQTSLSFCFPVDGVQECNLMEENEQTLNHGSSQFNFEIRPYEIKTFRIKALSRK